MADEYLFQNKYRIKSNRLQWYDYRLWRFFVTICTDDREHFFGKIENGNILLNEIWMVAHEYRINIPKHFPHITLDEFVIMPNHVHGVLIVDWVDQNSMESVETPHGASHIDNRETRRVVSLQNKFGPQKTTSLWYIINQYKWSVTRQTYKHVITKEFSRQSNYYEHIIRDENELQAIRKYIIDNPKKWERDRNNVQQLYM